MPEDITFRPSAELLQDDELMALFYVFVDLGFSKFRLTGGEPTIRVNVVELVRQMAATPGVHELSMTTNGVLLARYAHALAEAGLKRCNISIDTLDPHRFRQLTRWGSLEDVWAGIKAAESAGLLPIKLNAVVVRGYNDTEDVLNLARLTLEHEWHIRYIEMMPFGDVSDFQQAQIVTEEELLQTIRDGIGPISLLNNGRLDGEARLYRLPGARGTLGFISTVTAPFCSACSRARLTADGRLRLCLLRENELDLLTPLRAGAAREDLIQIIRQGIWHKPWGHGLESSIVPMNRVMSEIGG
jgi:cyclic pyranopterin phosphate synthase